jgi:16S rRNA processing protein RimM
MDDAVVIGRVVRAHGLRGEVAIDVMSDVPGRFDVGVTVHVGGMPRTIVARRPHQGRMLVTFDGVPDRTAAEGLRGLTITAPAVDLSDTDAYFVHELVGMAVVTVDGEWLGDVVDVIEVPAAAGYDLLEVDRDGLRWLLPDADDLVEVADADGVDVLCVVDPPAGLLPGDEDAAEVLRPSDERASVTTDDDQG